MPAATESTPVSAEEARRDFLIIQHFDSAVLAVSGGSDSMALMHLAVRWAQDADWPGRFIVATVNHGLRPAAEDECRFVVEQAARLGLKAVTLNWAGPHPETGIAAAARETRYGLLFELARQHNAILVTGHTEDDQAETFMMRLARGSGVDGLSAMEAYSERNETGLLRPLLGVSRERLRATLRQASVPWVEDPTNENTDFERVRVRKALDVLQELGVTRDAIALSAWRLGRARQAIQKTVAELASAAVGIEANCFATLALEEWILATPEVRIRLLIELAKSFGGGQDANLAAAERLHDWIVHDQSRARTFAGCQFVRRKREIVVGREAARVHDVPLEVSADPALIWDDRYEIIIPQHMLPATVMAVKVCDGLARPSDVPDFVWQGLPVVACEAGNFTPVDPSPVTFRLIHAAMVSHDGT